MQLSHTHCFLRSFSRAQCGCRSNEMAERIFERYVPQRELPEEIRNLPPGETRCEYCGVSYLVHHEVKKLEGLVNELQSKLQSSQDKNKELFEISNSVNSKVDRLSNENETFKLR